MAYCVIDDLVNVIPEDRLSALTDDRNSGEPDEAVLQTAIDLAAEEMDAYLAVVARLPLSTVPDLLRSLNADLAVCRLFRRVNTGLPDVWDKAWSNAHQTLSDLAAGRRRLDLGQDHDAPRVFKAGVRKKEFPATLLDRY